MKAFVLCLVDLRPYWRGDTTGAKVKNVFLNGPGVFISLIAFYSACYWIASLLNHLGHWVSSLF